MSDKIKRSRGRPKHEVNEDNQELVRNLSAVGTTHEDIALKIGINADTLVKYYKKELDEGRIDAVSAMAKSLYKAGMKGDIRAMMFYLKTRGGWKETDRHEITGSDGSPVEMIVKWADE